MFSFHHAIYTNYLRNFTSKFTYEKGLSQVRLNATIDLCLKLYIHAKFDWASAKNGRILRSEYNSENK